MNFDSKTGVILLIGLLMLGTISFLAFYDFSAQFAEKDIRKVERIQKDLFKKKESSALLNKKLDEDWIALQKAFKTRDYRKARLLLNNFLYSQENYTLQEQYQKIDRIDTRLKKIEKKQKGIQEQLPSYERLTFLSGRVYRKEGPLDFKRRKEVWISVNDDISNKIVDRLGSKVLLKEQEGFAWITIYVQKDSDKRGMAFAIFDLKEGVYTSFISTIKKERKKK